MTSPRPASASASNDTATADTCQQHWRLQALTQLQQTPVSSICVYEDEMPQPQRVYIRAYLELCGLVVEVKVTDDCERRLRFVVKLPRLVNRRSAHVAHHPTAGANTLLTATLVSLY